MTSLTLFKRDQNKKADAYRKEGKIPGVIYGPEISSTPVYAEKKDFLKFFKEYQAGLTLINFENKNYQGILQEVQFHPITDEVIHFDIFVPSLKEKIVVKVPLKFVGTAPGVKEGGVLNINLEEVEVECLPQNIPQYFEVNLESLKEIGESIYIRDLKVPPEVKILIHPETPIVTLIKEQEVSEEASSS